MKRFTLFVLLVLVLVGGGCCCLADRDWQKNWPQEGGL